MKRVLAIILLVLGACGLLAAFHSMFSMFLARTADSLPVIVRTLLLFAFGIGFIAAAARLWDRWAVGLSLVLVLLGLGSIQTTPAPNDQRAGSVQYAFKFSGGLFLTAGIAFYLVAGRRRS